LLLRLVQTGYGNQIYECQTEIAGTYNYQAMRLFALDIVGLSVYLL